MDTLRSVDLRKALEFVDFTAAAMDLDDFARRTLQALHRLVPSDVTGLHRLDLPMVWNSAVMEPDIGVSPDAAAIFDRYVDQHPIITHYLSTDDARAYRFSDFVGRREFHRRELYNEFYRPLRVEHQLGAVFTRTPSLFVGCAVSREDRDFSDREQLLLDTVRPHLVRAYEHARARTEARGLVRALVQGLEGDRRAVLLVSEDGRIALAGERGRSWLATYLGGDAAHPDRLPERVDAWLRHSRERPEYEVELSLAFEQGDRRFVIRLLPSIGHEPVRILVLEQHRDHVPPDELEHFGLSRREAEILAWVSAGKSDAEIAAILSLSARTVAKHLEHVYDKLGVHSRTAAIAHVAARMP